MPAISVYFNKTNYDRLNSVCDSSNKKTSEVVNWLFQLGYVRNLELQAQEDERVANRYKAQLNDALIGEVTQ